MDWFVLEAVVLLWVIFAPAVLIYWIWLESHDRSENE